MKKYYLTKVCGMSLHNSRSLANDIKLLVVAVQKTVLH